MRIRRRWLGYDAEETNRYLSLLESEGNWLEAKIMAQERENVYRHGTLLSRIALLRQELEGLLQEVEQLTADMREADSRSGDSG